MTLTIELPRETLAALQERARIEQRPVAELAAEAVTDRLGTTSAAGNEEEFPLDDEAVENIRRGFADMDAGRTPSLDEARADFEATAVRGRILRGS